MIERLFTRTLIFVVLTIAAFGLMEPITKYTGMPEVMQCMKASGIIAWIEISDMWFRVVMNPRIDAQDLAKRIESQHDAKAMATVYMAQQLKWCVRLIAFIVLGWLL